MEDRQRVIDWVSQLIKDLTEKPEDLSFKAVVDEKGLLITVYAPQYVLGRLIGKGGKTADALRTIATIYGIQHNARVALKIDDSTK